MPADCESAEQGGIFEQDHPVVHEECPGERVRQCTFFRGAMCQEVVCRHCCSAAKCRAGKE